MLKAMRLIVALVLVAVWGCGDDGSPADGAADSGVDAPPDAAPMDGGDSAIAPLTITPPANPAWTCPANWRSVDASALAPGLALCEPWPEVSTPCAPHETRLPGDDACRSVGTTCPADGWPAALPTDGVVFVRPGSMTTPDGTRTAPYSTIAAALAALAPETAIIALAVGDYDERVEVRNSVTIRGACPEGTILRDTVIPLRAIGDIGMIIENLSISSSGSTTGRLQIRTTSAVLRNVALDDVVATLAAATVILDNVVVRTDFDSIDTGLTVDGTDEVILHRVLLEDFGGQGINLTADGVGTLTDVYLQRGGGDGMLLRGDLTLERVVVDDVAETGIIAVGGGTMTDMIVRDVDVRGPSTGGLILDGEWEIDGLSVARTGDVGVLATGGRALLRNAIIEGPLPESPAFGRGVVVTGGAALIAERLVIAKARDLGVLADGRSSVSLTDTTINGVAESPSGGFGRCIHGQFSSPLHLERVRLDGCTEAALTVHGGSRAVLMDVHISDVMPTGCPPEDPGTVCVGAAGIGLLALEDGAIEGARIIVERAALAGVIIVPGGGLDLNEGAIRSSLIGVNVQDPDFELSRVTDGMVFTDNGVNLDSTSLPVPGGTTTAGP